MLRELQGAEAWFYPLADEVLARLDPAIIETHALRDDADYLYAAAAFLNYEDQTPSEAAGCARLLWTWNTLKVQSARPRQLRRCTRGVGRVVRGQRPGCR